jgi:hypothetical protein
MSSLALTDAKIYVNGTDLSGQLNQVALEYAADTLDATTFGSTTRVNAGGLLAVNSAVEGLWDSSTAAAPDPIIFANVGTADLPVVIVPQGATVGNIAYLFRAMRASYKPGGSVGELFKFSASMMGSGGQPLVRGKLFYSGSATGNTNGTAIQLGAVASGKYIYAAIHVFSGSGSFVAKVQSDDNSGFTSATDQITFATVATGTAVASEWKRLAGPITDDYWRITVTNPATRNFAIAIGIL